MPEQVMVVVALAFAALVLLLGAWGVLAPRSIITFIESWSSRGGLWLAVLMRVAFGATLLLASSLSRTPLAFQVLGGLVLASGIALPLFGYTRFRAFIDWWSKLPPTLVRAWGLLAVAFGMFVLWSMAQPITITVPENPIEYRS